MSKAIPIALAGVKARSSSTTCLIRKIGPLADGTYRYQSGLDADVIYDDGDGNGPQTYVARIGYDPSALITSADLGVDNAEGQMFAPLVTHELEGITKAQVEAGVLDKVKFVVYLVDYTNLTSGNHEVWSGGTLGEVRWKYSDSVLIPEERSLSQQLKQSIVEIDSKTCRAKFGSQPIGTGGGAIEERKPCKFDFSTLWVSGTVTSVGAEDDLVFTDTSLNDGDDYYAPGVVEWLTGSNAGQKLEVESFAVGEVTLTYPTINAITVGDTYRIRPDCTKNFTGHSSCDTWWGSLKTLRFRGEPYIPTGDASQANTPGASTGTDTGGGDPTHYPAPEPSGTPSTPGGRTYGATVVDPVTYGADPTGATDSTSAFTAAYAALPVGGGIVRPSAGTYQIDPDVQIFPLSNTFLDLATHNVTLQASYTSADKKDVLRIQDVDNVEIAGGTIIGYRASWNPIVGTTSEWGHCIGVFGSTRITIRDITLRDAVGDGISIGGHSGTPSRDIVIDNVISTNNRRQGLSIVWAERYGGTGYAVKVTDSTFSHINGTSPECGIDIEPEAGETVEYVLIDNCKFQNNAKYGINILKRSNATGASVNNITIQNSLIGGDTNSGNQSNGIVTIGASNVTVQNNTISYNRATGLRSTSTANLTITGNTFKHNYTSHGIDQTDTAHVIASGLNSPATDPHVLISTAASGQSITSNTFWY